MNKEEANEFWGRVKDEYGKHGEEMRFRPVEREMAMGRFMFYSALLISMGLQKTIPSLIEAAATAEITLDSVDQRN